MPRRRPRWVVDVATAFLQGDAQKRMLWARIPRDACDLIGVPANKTLRFAKANSDSRLLVPQLGALETLCGAWGVRKKSKSQERYLWC